ncbi:MAG: hypothetical protein Kow0090_06300 [Myxococcota bacterium]
MESAKTVLGALFFAIAAFALISCGGTTEVKPTGAQSPEELYSESLYILNELDKAYLVELAEGADKVEIEYRTHGGMEPSAKDKFLRYFTMTDNDKAWKRFRALSKNESESHLGDLGQAYIYVRWNILDKAEEKLQESRPKFRDGDPLLSFVEGSLYFAKGDFGKAGESFKRVTAIMPGNLRVTLKMAKLFEKEGRLDDAATLYRNAIEATPGVFILQKELGDILAASEKTDEAIEAYKKAVEINQNDAGTRVKLGDIYKGRGNTEEAIANYEKAAEINPSDKNVMLKLDELYTAKGDKEGEFSTLIRLIEISPKESKYHLRAGRVGYELGKLERAISAYESVIKLEGENAGAYWGLGRCYKKQGQDVKAVQNYLKALSLDATLVEAKSEYDSFKGNFNIAEPITAPTADGVYKKIVQRVKKVADEYLKENKKLKGEIEVEVEIDEKGKVIKLEFLKDTLMNERIKASIFGNTLEAQFPPKKQFITLPFIFE